MGKPLTTAGCLWIVAVAACGASQESSPVFPEHQDLAALPADERPVNPTEKQANAPESESEAPAAPEKAEEPLAVAPPVPAPAPVEREFPGSDPAPAAEPSAPRPQAEALAVPGGVQSIVDAIDRYDSDRDLDAGRHPGELLAFLGLSRGMQVAEIGAGGGYTTELLARSVGGTGKVWAENPPAFMKSARRDFDERLGKTVMESVTALERPLDAPLPPEARDLDAVVSVLVYHDTVWLGADRDKMNKAVFAALKPGGEYVIVDHSAADGHGIKDVKTLHRIEEAAVVREVLRAGFRQDASANFLRNPQDDRTWNDSGKGAGDRRGTSDRFVLKFVRP